MEMYLVAQGNDLYLKNHCSKRSLAIFIEIALSSSYIIQIIFRIF